MAGGCPLSAERRSSVSARPRERRGLAVEIPEAVRGQWFSRKSLNRSGIKGIHSKSPHFINRSVLPMTTVRHLHTVDKTLRSRFAAVRVRPAHRDYWRLQPHDEEWLLIEWPEGESAPIKYWFSTLPPDTTLDHLVETAKLRWGIEHDDQELKQELGLDHYEGRGWRGFHHHMALCVAAYGFLISERV